MFKDLYKGIDQFMKDHGQTGGTKMKEDLLELVQKAIAHGEEKDQNKITGIIVKGLKTLIGGRE